MFLQLSELNRLSSSDVQWELNGTKVIPKSLNVAKLSSQSFTKTITFNQIKRKLTNAAFNRGLANFTYLIMAMIWINFA